VLSGEITQAFQSTRVLASTVSDLNGNIHPRLAICPNSLIHSQKLFRNTSEVKDLIEFIHKKR
jgi:hypothetical protein